MAKYAISREGLESLNKLSRELVQVVAGIENATQHLYHQVEALESGLGVYEKDVLQCIRQVIAACQQGREGVEYLVTTGIPQQMAMIEEIMYMFGEESGGGDDEPPQKKLVLRRR